MGTDGGRGGSYHPLRTPEALADGEANREDGHAGEDADEAGLEGCQSIDHSSTLSSTCARCDSLTYASERSRNIASGTNQPACPSTSILSAWRDSGTT